MEWLSVTCENHCHKMMQWPLVLIKSECILVRGGTLSWLVPSELNGTSVLKIQIGNSVGEQLPSSLACELPCSIWLSTLANSVIPNGPLV